MIAAVVLSCQRAPERVRSPLPSEVSNAWKKIEFDIGNNTAAYSVRQTYDDRFLLEFLVKKINQNWLVQGLHDESNAQGVYANSIEVQTRSGTFRVKDNADLTDTGNRFSLAFFVNPKEPLTDAQRALLDWGRFSVLLPIRCEQLTMESLENANSIDVVERAFPDHPEWTKLVVKGFRTPQTPFGGPRDPIKATGGEIVVDTANDYRIVSWEFDIDWVIDGQVTKNKRKQRVEYIDGLDHFVAYSEWEGPASNGMVQKNEIKKLPLVPNPEEFSLAYYGIQYHERSRGGWWFPIIAGTGLLLMAAALYYRRRGNSSH